jgi:hypothetical protein
MFCIVIVLRVHFCTVIVVREKKSLKSTPYITQLGLEKTLVQFGTDFLRPQTLGKIKGKCVGEFAEGTRLIAAASISEHDVLCCLKTFVSTINTLTNFCT